MYKEKLKKDYENACNAYLKAFCEKHEFYGLDNPETYWIGDQVGEIANCGDFSDFLIFFQLQSSFFICVFVIVFTFKKYLCIRNFCFVT